MVQNSESLDDIRRLAEVNLNVILSLQNRLLDENSSAFRWILASLLTINGGAAIGSISTEFVTIQGKFCGGVAFSSGIFFALMLAYVTTFSVKATTQPLVALIDLWTTAAITGEVDPSDLEAKQAEVRSSVKPWSLISHLFGWLSFFSFAIGLAIIGTELK